MPDDCIDSIVTDPPYELGFMGKKWDSTGIAYNVDVWRECLRVLKPGGHLLSFGGSRTYHRMACAIEDAGFEIRDQIMWIYGSGFPKSMDISKAITKADLGFPQGSANPLSKNHGKYKSGCSEENKTGRGFGAGAGSFMKEQGEKEILELTPNAQQWDGWGTALKPAHEPIVVARKPLGEKTVAENVLKWGTGGINVDGCRIELNGEKNPSIARYNSTPQKGNNGWKHKNRGGNFNEQTKKSMEQGRFPANLILDEEAGRLLDEQSGISKSTGGTGESSRGALGNRVYGKYENVNPASNMGGLGDVGGASRFFYCAKASKAERRESKHPTVKPLKLMRHLVRLTTPPDGIVLDPFAGSGTTLEAAILEGFNFVGIEKQTSYIPDIQARINDAQARMQGNLFANTNC